MKRYIEEHINLETQICANLHSNVWLGVTVESQKYLWRIDELLNIPAPVHFVSCEPLLDPVDLREYLGPNKINWVIVGAETGSGARYMHLDQARWICKQCKEGGIPFFFKKASKGDEIPKDLMVREWP